MNLHLLIHMTVLVAKALSILKAVTVLIQVRSIIIHGSVYLVAEEEVFILKWHYYDVQL